MSTETKEMPAQTQETGEVRAPASTEIRQKIKEQLGEFLTLYGKERTPEEDIHLKEVGKELGASLDSLGIKTHEQREKFVRLAKEKYKEKSTAQPTENDELPEDQQTETRGENEERETITIDLSDHPYADLLDLKQDALDMLDVSGDIKKDLILAKREAVSKKDPLGAQLVIEVAKISLKDMLKENGSLAVTDAVDMVRSITDAAKSATKEKMGLLGKKEVPVDSLTEAAEDPQVHDEVIKLLKTIDNLEDVSLKKKEAFFALIEKVTGVAYTAKKSEKELVGADV
ncbi:MAG: hypothetical protein Q7S16_00335 [bacterium]|nr:hypothetical protein [bacterium]